ncbi:MAG TPA: NAD(P)/FAD-dependent oxidoreductase [Verrucomicrobiae bacterium]|nr:NAD(P)/FAD-dependent oxidoreductase [Verrucomicrobiae bacterium]
MSETDVIVVGGGPAGAAAATGCAQRGLRVTLIEHARFPRHKVCGDTINPNCWPILKRLGVASKIRDLPHDRVDGATYTATNRSIFTVDLPPATVAIRRSSLDAALLDHARSLGAQVIEGETVHDILPGGRVRTNHGEYAARLGIVGADGRHSVIARRAGLASGRTPRDGHIAFQSHFEAPAALDHRVQLHLFRGGYCGLVRVDAERVNLCIITGPQAARFHRDCEALFAHTVWQNPHFRELGIAPEPLDPLRSAHPLQSPAGRAAASGVFLTGDALRVMEPFTGQGIFFALRTGELAAEAITGQSRREEWYAASVATLYQGRARTNHCLRRVMYHERIARAVIPLLQHAPRLARWLTDNVLGGDR